MRVLKRGSVFFTAVILMLTALISVLFVIVLPKANAADSKFSQAKADTTVKLTADSASTAAGIGSNYNTNGTVMLYDVHADFGGGHINAGMNLEESWQIKYDIYSATPEIAAGVAFGNLGFMTSKWEQYILLTGITDTDGNPYSQWSTVGALATPDWYSRTINLGQFTAEQRTDVRGLTFSVNSNAFSALTSPFVIYIKNARVEDKNGNVIQYLFYHGDSATPAPLNSVPKTLSYAFPAAFTAKNSESNIDRGESVDLKSLLNLPAGTEGADYTLTYKAAFGDTDVSDTVLAGSMFTPTEQGAYTLKVKSVSNVAPDIGLPYDVAFKLIVGTVPVLDKTPVDTAEKAFEELNGVILPKISGTIGSVRYDGSDIKPVVTSKSGAAVDASGIIYDTANDEWMVNVPDYGWYTARYTLENGDLSDSVSFDFKAGILKFSNLPSIGNMYSPLDLQATATNPDGSNPEITVIVKNYGGVIQPLKNNMLYPSANGKYTYSLSAVDFAGDEIIKTGSITIGMPSADSSVIKIHAPVSSERKPANKVKYLNAKLLENVNVNFSSGDRLAFDIFMPNPISGSIMLDFTGTSGSGAIGWDSFVQRNRTAAGLAAATDTDGVPIFTYDPVTGPWNNWSDTISDSIINPNGSIKDKLSSGGKSVWYTREYEVPEIMTGIDLGHMFLYVFSIDEVNVDALDFYIGGVRVIRADGSAMQLFDGNRSVVFLEPKDMYVDNSTIGWNTIGCKAEGSYIVNSGAPTPAIKKKPSGVRARANEQYTIVLPEDVFFNQLTGEYAATELENVKDSGGATVSAPGGIFTPKEDIYTVTVKGTAKGYTEYTTFEINVQDIVISFDGQFPSAAERLAQVTLPAVSAVDYNDRPIPAENITMRAEFFLVTDTEFEKPIKVDETATGNRTFLLDKSGVYRFTYDATDGSKSISLFKLIAVTDTVKPVINDVSIPDVQVGTDWTVVNASATDGDVSGLIVTYVIKNSAEETVEPIDGKIKFTVIGDYAIIYFTADVAGNTQTKSKIFSVTDLIKPQILVTGGPSETASIGDIITMPEVSATDNYYQSADIKIDMKVKLTAGGDFNVATPDGKFTVDKAGVYKITITATDGSGNKQTEVIVITVADTDKPVFNALPDFAQIKTGETWTMPTATASDISAVTVTGIVKDGAGNTVEPQADGTYKFSKAGTYKVVYLATDASGNFETLTKDLIVKGKSGGCKGEGSIAVLISLGAMFIIMKKRF